MTTSPTTATHRPLSRLIQLHLPLLPPPPPHGLLPPRLPILPGQALLPKTTPLPHRIDALLSRRLALHASLDGTVIQLREDDEVGGDVGSAWFSNGIFGEVEVVYFIA